MFWNINYVKLFVDDARHGERDLLGGWGGLYFFFFGGDCKCEWIKNQIK